jgi:hypothetical protein
VVGIGEGEAAIVAGGFVTAGGAALGREEVVAAGPRLADTAVA